MHEPKEGNRGAEATIALGLRRSWLAKWSRDSSEARARPMQTSRLGDVTLV